MTQPQNWIWLYANTDSITSTPVMVTKWLTITKIDKKKWIKSHKSLFQKRLITKFKVKSLVSRKSSKNDLLSASSLNNAIRALFTILVSWGSSDCNSCVNTSAMWKWLSGEARHKFGSSLIAWRLICRINTWNQFHCFWHLYCLNFQQKRFLYMPFQKYA